MMVGTFSIYIVLSLHSRILYFLQYLLEEGIATIPILQMKKQRLRGGMCV